LSLMIYNHYFELRFCIKYYVLNVYIHDSVFYLHTNYLKSFIEKNQETKLELKEKKYAKTNRLRKK